MEFSFRLILLFLVLLPQDAWSRSTHMMLEPHRKDNPQISGLDISDPTLSILDTGEIEFTARYDRPDWILVYRMLGSQEFYTPNKKSGFMRVLIPLNYYELDVEFVAIGPDHKYEVEVIHFEKIHKINPKAFYGRYRLRDNLRIGSHQVNFDSDFIGADQQAVLRFQQGLSLEQQGNKSEAVKRYTQSYQEDPKYMMPWVKAIRLHTEMGNTKLATATRDEMFLENPPFISTNDPDYVQETFKREFNKPIVTFHTSKSNRIPGLNWLNDYSEIVSGAEYGNSFYYVTLNGTYTGNEKLSVRINGKKSQIQREKQKFWITVPILKAINKVVVISNGQAGNSKSQEDITVEAEGFARIPRTALELHEIGSFGKAEPSPRYTLMFGSSYTSYREASFDEFQIASLLVKGSIRIPFKEEVVENEVEESKWTFLGDAVGSLVPFYQNIENQSLTFLGFHGRVGYKVPFIQYPLSVILQSGLYYTTSFSTEDFFGYKGITGPEFVLQASYQIYSGDRLGFRLKSAFVGGFYGLLGLENRVFSGSLFWKDKTSSKGSLSVSLDYTGLSYAISEKPIRSNTLSLAIGYSL